MWVVMRLTTEKSWEVAGLDMKFDPASGLLGLLPVYKTREDAEREWPGSPLVYASFVADALEGE